MDIYQKTRFFYEHAPTEKSIIGKSHFGRDIFVVKMGEGTPVGIAQYAMHGREFVTAEIAFAHYERGLFVGSCWLIPLVNPDGALLSERGVLTAPPQAAKRLIEWNNGRLDFSEWKANGNGVDLNVNFPARWGEGIKNTRKEGGENYIGRMPFSEKETVALKKFTEKIHPDYTVSYHTKGEEIYWYFYQSMRTCPRDKSLALALSRSTGYPLAHAKGSAGGYKDWCIQRLGIPAFTVEAGEDALSHPIQGEQAASLIEKNRSALYDLSKEFMVIQ